VFGDRMLNDMGKLGHSRKGGLGAGHVVHYVLDARSIQAGSGMVVMNISAQMKQDEVLRIKLEMLRREHRDLDEAIHALQERGSADMLTIRRLKKQKLVLKDQIRLLEDRILPDIIA
jgi:hypothetical protein